MSANLEAKKQVVEDIKAKINESKYLFDIYTVIFVYYLF